MTLVRRRGPLEEVPSSDHQCGEDVGEGHHQEDHEACYHNGQAKRSELVITHRIQAGNQAQKGESDWYQSTDVTVPIMDGFGHLASDRPAPMAEAGVAAHDCPFHSRRTPPRRDLARDCRYPTGRMILAL